MKPVQSIIWGSTDWRTTHYGAPLDEYGQPIRVAPEVVTDEAIEEVLDILLDFTGYSKKNKWPEDINSFFEEFMVKAFECQTLRQLDSLRREFINRIYDERLTKDDKQRYNIKHRKKRAGAKS